MRQADIADPRVALILGDPLVAEPEARAAIGKLLADGDAQLDLDIIRLPDDPLEAAIESLSQVGMFSRGRCVWLRGLSTESKSSIESLLAFLNDGLPAESSLVATASKLDKRSKIFKWFRDNGRVVDLRIEVDRYGRLDQDSLARFVAVRVEANGLPKPAARTLNLIASRLSHEMGEIVQAVDRLCLACRPGAKLDQSLVEQHLPDRAEAWVFDLTDAISRQQLAVAVTTLERLLSQGEAPLRVLAPLATHIANLHEASRYLDRIGGRSIGDQGQFARKVFPGLPEELRLRYANNGFRAWHAFKAAAAFGAVELRRLHRAILGLDLQLKSSRTPALLLFTAFVQEACARKA